MDKTFDAAAEEARIYAEWETEGCFAAGANASRAETFCIVIPPPNVTGSLHMGHALNNTVQDILIRWHRMRGFDTLWQPGTDHAGIATQMVVERKLAEEGNIRRTDMGRDAFIERVWRQKAESEGVILGQLKRLGASCDWSRTEFTMSDTLSKAVLKVFVDLYNQGLIYKGKRLVNWDPHFETAISDLEVENIDRDGSMWHFKYPLAGGETYEYVEKDEDGTVTLRETRDYISIATTRPETMLGDGAVAVHPGDERYAPIVGKLCEIPVGPKAHRRHIPIITDEYPDPDFGSGAVKITGAHDFNDYAVAKRGNIPCYRLMDTKAAMRADGAPYAEEAAKAQAIVEGKDFTEAQIDAINLVPDAFRGLDRYDARKKVIAEITAEGLAVMIPNPDHDAEAEEPGPEHIPLVENNKMTVPTGDRSKVVIEPMLTDQWFVDAETLAKPALEAVRKEDTTFAPKAWEKTYFQWLDNIEPWCISRQLWWGHQVPVWYGLPVVSLSDAEGSNTGLPRVFNSQRLVGTDAGDQAGISTGYDDFLTCVVRQDEAAPVASAFVRQFLLDEYVDVEIDTVFVASEDEAIDMLYTEINSGRRVYPIWRDPDVLDTWFSSALWPFSTLGWPDETPELERYYKTDVLITGFDIIFFWVARMMMMGLHFMKDAEGKPEVPFRDVYVHALVRDKHGKKMSKSLGNVIDPLELIDEYGADAVRFTLASMAAMGRDIKLDTGRVAGYRNFSTKLWNAARFAEMNGCYAAPPPSGAPEASRMINKWIIGETVRVAAQVDEALAGYRFNDAAGTLYAHIWGTFCDWYVELSKPLLQGEDGAAKAETQAVMAWALDRCLVLLHPIMPFVTESLWGGLATREKRLIHADWPDLNADLIDPAADAEIGWVVKAIEGIRSVRAEMGVPPSAKIEMVLTGHTPAVAMRLLRNAELIQRLARLSECAVAEHAPEGSVTVPMEDCTINLPLAGVIDVAAERARLTKARDKAAKEVKSLQGKLSNQGFLAKAPEDVVEEQRERLAVAEAECEKLEAALTRLAALE
ncbi:MAG: valine--tRNA ligase [Pseudomonadota bacterium]